MGLIQRLWFYDQSQDVQKNTFSAFLTLVLGQRNVWNAAEILMIVNNTVGLENQRLVDDIECASTWEEIRPACEKMKHFITDTRITIRALLFNPHLIDHTFSFILLANNKDVIVIE